MEIPDRTAEDWTEKSIMQMIREDEFVDRLGSNVMFPMDARFTEARLDVDQEIDYMGTVTHNVTLSVVVRVPRT